MKLTTIILTHNEQEFLPACIKSVQNISDQIIICDKNSTDQTLNIAQKSQAKIVKFSGKYFDEWRNLAASQTDNQWILYLDPDERLTAALADEINKIIHSDNQFSAYQISRKNYWWGKYFKHCGASPDYVTRLIKKNKLKKWQGIIHESPVIDGNIGILNNQIIHLTHRDLISGLKKSYQWTALEAQLLYDSNHKPVMIKNLISVTVCKFFEKYIKQKGYKEGVEGFIESFVQAINRFMVYVLLWQLQQNPNIKQKYLQLDK